MKAFGNIFISGIDTVTQMKKSPDHHSDPLNTVQSTYQEGCHKFCWLGISPFKYIRFKWKAYNYAWFFATVCFSIVYLFLCKRELKSGSELCIQTFVVFLLFVPNIDLFIVYGYLMWVFLPSNSMHIEFSEFFTGIAIDSRPEYLTQLNRFENWERAE